MDDLSRLILLIVLLFLCGFFSLCESSLSYCNQFKLKVKEDDGNKGASLVLKALDKFDKYLIDILICTNIVNILISIIATLLMIKLVSNTSLSRNASEYGSLFATILSTIVVFFVGEIIPKTIGKVKADTISCIIIYPLYVINLILTPISIFFVGILTLTKKIFKVKEKNILVSEEDFQDIVENIEDEGIIDNTESEIIQSAVDFDDLKVKEVMKEVKDIVSYNIDWNLSKDKLIDFLCEHNYSRIPVYKESIDNIIGILHTRLLLKVLMNNDENYNIEKLLVKPLFVSPNIHLDTIFEEFKKNKTHMAIVYKDDKTLGLVTMEDVLEELVGDIDESNEGVIND